MTTAMETKLRYVVEWCVSCPRDENGDLIPDRAVYSVRSFPTMLLAESFAKKLLAERKDFFGACAIEVEEYDRRGWERTARYTVDRDGIVERTR